MYYSHNANFPSKLPWRIRLSDGTTRTDPSTFTEEDIADAGYVKVLTIEGKEHPLIGSSRSLNNVDLDELEQNLSVFDRLVWNGSIISIEEKPVDQKNRIIIEQWMDVTEERTRRLAETDWLVLFFYEKGVSVPEAIASYRQALRDITKQSDPFNILWPELDPGDYRSLSTIRD